MKRFFCIFALLFLTSVATPTLVHADGTIGIVLIHGKLGLPMGISPPRGPTVGAGLIGGLRKAHYVVATPEMCFSRRRGFDAAYADCFRDIDTAIAGLKARGASVIVVGGLSLGGNIAIAYGATHPGLLGIIGLSPADDPTHKATSDPEFAAGIARAHDLIAQGKGDVKVSFDDVNTGPQGSYKMTLSTTPRIFLSFSDSDSAANIPANVAKLTMPLLWVAGSEDPTQSGGPGFAFDKAPPNALNRYVTVDATHLEVPDAATTAVLAWLRDLTAPHP